MSNLEVPKPDGFDKAHSIAKFLGGILPFGGTAMELWSMIVESPISIRRDQFLELLHEGMRKQEKTIINMLGRVEKVEEFESTVIEASVIAAKTHQKEKHKMLRNAIINGVKGDMKFDQKQIFMGFVGSLTVQHINILRFLDYYKAYIRDHKMDTYGKFYALLVDGHGVVGSPPLEPMTVTAFRFLMIDLKAKGLIFISESIGEVSGYVFQDQLLSTGDNASEKYPYVRVSDFGGDFLKFIEDDPSASD